MYFILGLPGALIDSIVALCLYAQAADLVRVSHFGFSRGSHWLSRGPLILQTWCMYLTLSFPAAPIDSIVTVFLCVHAADLLRVSHFGVARGTH